MRFLIALSLLAGTCATGLVKPRLQFTCEAPFPAERFELSGSFPLESSRSRIVPQEQPNGRARSEHETSYGVAGSLNVSAFDLAGRPLSLDRMQVPVVGRITRVETRLDGQGEVLSVSYSLDLEASSANREAYHTRTHALLRGGGASGDLLATIFRETLGLDLSLSPHVAFGRVTLFFRDVLVGGRGFVPAREQQLHLQIPDRLVSEYQVPITCRFTRDPFGLFLR